MERQIEQKKPSTDSADVDDSTGESSPSDSDSDNCNKSQHYCTSCDNNNPVCSWCAQCKEQLCDGCVKAHRRVKVTKDHSISDIGKESQQYCTSCDNNNPVHSWCAQCQEHLCDDCVEAHQRVKVTKGHSISDVVTKHMSKPNKPKSRVRPTPLVTKRSASTNRSVEVQACKKRKLEVNGIAVIKADYNKKQYCYFCGGKFSKICRHLETVHSDKEDVKTLAALEVKSPPTKERRRAIKKLANLGNHRNNLEAVTSGRGELIVAKRPPEGMTKTFRDYYPCVFCLGWYSKQELWKHARDHCPFRLEKRENIDSTGILTEGRALVREQPTGHPQLSKLLSKLRDGAVKDIILGDELG